MIVENREETLTKANEIADKITKIINKEIKEFIKDDPAEYIYFLCHIMGNMLARICLSLEGYAQVYAIPNLTTDSINEWISAIAKEHVKVNVGEKQ